MALPGVLPFEAPRAYPAELQKALLEGGLYRQGVGRHAPGGLS